MTTRNAFAATPWIWVPIFIKVDMPHQWEFLDYLGNVLKYTPANFEDAIIKDGKIISWEHDRLCLGKGLTIDWTGFLDKFLVVMARN